MVIISKELLSNSDKPATKGTPFLLAIVFAFSLGSIPITSHPSFLATDKKSPTPAPMSKILPFSDSEFISFNLFFKAIDLTN